MNVIETRGLAKAYGDRRVVSDFAMTVAAGDIYGFVGKNGAGKSTVMKMICGAVTPTAGEVVLFGAVPAVAGAAARMRPRRPIRRGASACSSRSRRCCRI